MTDDHNLIKILTLLNKTFDVLKAQQQQIDEQQLLLGCKRQFDHTQEFYDNQCWVCGKLGHIAKVCRYNFENRKKRRTKITPKI
jgi:hypothetical protein